MALTVPLPPYIRRFQQWWLWQDFGLPITIGFGGSLIMQGCFTAGLENITYKCFMAAVDSTVLTFATAWIKGHSTGSPAFAKDGNLIPSVPAIKQLTDTAVDLKKRAVDPNDGAVKLEVATDVQKTLDKVQNTVVEAVAHVEEVKNGH